MADKVMSPRFSFKGWEFTKWFIGNWKSIKELIKIGAPLWASYSMTANPYLVLILTGVGKLVLDSIEYFVKEQSE